MTRIKKFFKNLLYILLVVLSFFLGYCSNNKIETKSIRGGLLIQNIREVEGEYVSSNIIQLVADIPQNDDGSYSIISQGVALFNGYDESFENIAESDIYYISGYEEDALTLYFNDNEGRVLASFIPSENIVIGPLYTFSFKMTSEFVGNADKYTLSDFMFNEGPYMQYEPVGLKYGSSDTLGMFQYSTLQKAIFDDETPTQIESLDYDIVPAGFVSKNWDTSSGRVDYGIIADFGESGYDFNKYNTINILNGSINNINSGLKFGQRIYIYFSGGVYSVNGADLDYQMSNIDLLELRADYGNIIYKIYYVGYGEDYLPGGLSTDNYYTAGYNSGYNAGSSVGYEEGYQIGRNNGLEEGKMIGKQEGYTEGIQAASESMGIVRSALSFISDFTSIEILPGIKIIYLLGLIVMISVFKWIMGVVK